MTSRRNWTARQRLGVFEAHGGACHICGLKIDGTREPWDLEHIIPLALGGEDALGNLAPAHRSCHQTKTKDDVRVIAKANRVRAKHNGARKRSTFPGSRDSRFKKKINGEVVQRWPATPASRPAGGSSPAP